MSSVTDKRGKRIQKAFTKSETPKVSTGEKEKERKLDSEKSEVEEYKGQKIAVRKDEMSYEKLSLHEQILLRPDTYIGSTTTLTGLDPIWTFEDGKIVRKVISTNDGLLRLFVEIVSNAIDNVWRSVTQGISPKFIKIDITRNSVKVWNDGRNIPTVKHEKEGIPIPELIFGNLLTSSNYNDNEERKTSGKNGLGSKAVCIFSTSFKLDIFNKEEKVIYKQSWSNNMKDKQEPALDKTSKNFPKTTEEGKNGYTCIEFSPDFSRFGMTEFSDDILSSMYKLVYDTAMIVAPNKVSVFLNGQEIKIAKFTDYVNMYFEEPPTNMITFQTSDSYVVLAPHTEWCAVSFVNGIFTRDGGVHVDKWAEAIFRPIIEKLNGSKGKGIDMRDVKKHFFFFVYADLDKPKFNDQSKNKLSSPNPTVEVKPTQIAKLMKWDFVEKIENGLKAKEMQGFQKESERKKGTVRVEGLDDANLAGKGKSECALFITEGASAKTFVVAGIKYGFGPYKGRDTIGVLPIRGKFLNVKNASTTVLSKNAELLSITKALGLVYGTDYTDDKNFAKLRYNRVVAATDADSVTGDTPLLLRKNGKIEVRTIDSIAEGEWIGEDKQYNKTSYEVWTEKGWTNIVHVMKHKTTKKLYRVVTHTGIVDVTEDHSLLDEEGKEIAPGDCEVGMKLLHAFPTANSSDLHESITSIVNMTEDNFTTGFSSKIDAQKVYVYFKSQGYYVSLDVQNSQYYVTVRPSSYEPIANPQEIKKILPLGEVETYVYDLETENHHFQAGIGQMIVHNTDGFHITGLLYNLFHTLYPTLLKRPGFFCFMRVPIIKITASKKAKPLNFYFYDQAKQYIQEHNTPSNHIRYFKGLGTARDEDIKQDFGKRVVEMVLDEKGDQMMENVFGGDESDFRKKWMQHHEPRTVFPEVPEGQMEQLEITEFLNYELINYSIDHCKRSIPSIIDGLKESQRKVLYAAFKKNLKYGGESLKVAQFGAYVAEQTNYHHGEANLYDTIVKMAQRYVGSNNLALFLNDGQMGSRQENGKDAAAARYIFTRLDMCTRDLFREEDDDVLVQRLDDGDLVEPETYYPIVPLILVNGTVGSIASGWSSTIPPFDLKAIVQWIKAWLQEKDLPTLIPAFRGFKGKVELDGTKVVTTGIVTESKKGASITEIPLGKRMMSIGKYKEFLDDLREDGKIKSIENQSSENGPCFYVKTGEGFEANIANLNLADSISMNNMVLFDKDGKLRRYESVDAILMEWCDVRFDQYEVRKKHQLAALEVEKTFLYNRIRFIQDVLDDKIKLKGKDEEQLCKELEEEKYDKKESGYDYLLQTSVKSMTAKVVKDLQTKYAGICATIKSLSETSIKTIWMGELDQLVKSYEKWCLSNECK